MLVVLVLEVTLGERGDEKMLAVGGLVVDRGVALLLLLILLVAV